MQQMTVKKLYKHLEKVLKENPTIADKYIIISDDMEGNSYHGLWYGITDGENVKECIECSNGVSDSTTDDANLLVILG